MNVSNLRLENDLLLTKLAVGSPKCPNFLLDIVFIFPHTFKKLDFNG